MNRCLCFKKVKTDDKTNRLLDISRDPSVSCGDAQPILRRFAGRNEHYIYAFDKETKRCLTGSWRPFNTIFDKKYNYSALLCNICSGVVLTFEEMKQLENIFHYSCDLDRDIMHFLNEKLNLKE